MKANTNPKGHASKIAVAETRKEIPIISHNPRSPESNSENALIVAEVRDSKYRDRQIPALIIRILYNPILAGSRQCNDVLCSTLQRKYRNSLMNCRKGCFFLPIPHRNGDMPRASAGTENVQQQRYGTGRIRDLDYSSRIPSSKVCFSDFINY